MKQKTIILVCLLLAIAQATYGQKKANHLKGSDREVWVKTLDKMATPVLENIAKGELKKNMNVAFSPIWDKRPFDVAYLEAFGRLMAGIAPFLALPPDNTSEGKTRARLLLYAQKGIAQAVDPQSPDYLFSQKKVPQTIVDAAHLAQALLLAPEVLWEPLDTITKQRLIFEFIEMRNIKPFRSNWLLFGAMCETFLLTKNVEIVAPRIDDAIDQITKWYVGDGWYSDGDRFAFDHYNGFVIHPMLVIVLENNIKHGRRTKTEYDIAYKRMQRYSTFLERYIAPDGTFLVAGRSSTYRMGGFQPLALLAYQQNLPSELSPGQVRAALTAALKRVFVANSFDKNGWLTLGLVGDKQSNLADYYTNTGSLYVTSLFMFPLGLPAQNAFWTDKPEDWTQKRAWSGQVFKKDYAVPF